MTLQNINRAMMAVLLSTSAALVLVVLWGLSQLQTTYKLAQDYYQVRETLSGDWRARINDYLDTGDGVKLDAAIQQLDAIATGELTRLPDSLQAQLQPPIAALQDALNNDLRGAGKLAGDPQALLMNDENELRGKLALLAGLAADKQRTQPDLSSHYLVAINEMHDELVQVIFSRERHYQHGSAETEKNIAARISALKNLQQQLNALPSLQVMIAKQKSEFDLGGSDDASAEERSSELRREIGSVLNRYHDDMQRTGRMLAAGTGAKQAVREQVQALLQLLAERETDISAYQSGIRHKVQFALFTLILMVLAVCAVLFWLQYQLSQVARSVGEFQKKLASGDLRERLHLHSRIEDINELGQSTEVLQNSLIELTQALNERSGQVASASVLVLQSTQELQTSVERQLENSTQASSAIGQMSSASRTVSAEVAAVVAITREADLTLTDGAGIIDRSVTGMSILAAEIAATISALNQLQSHASGIQAFVGNIQGIADQTNLLALNAAIEAARAGEQGRGFAVVADEVRTLAQRSSEATIEIERLVEKVNASARDLADVMHRQTASAQQTAEEIRAAGSAYQDLEAGVLRIRTAIADIAELTAQQDQAAHAVQSFISDTVNASAESKARSQDSVTISMQLDQIARQVREIAQQFQT